MKMSRWLALGSLLPAAASFNANAQNSAADSTGIRAATAMGTSVCANLTATGNREFYKTVPTGMYKDASSGDCLGAAACEYGLNAAGTGCAGGLAPGQFCPTGTTYDVGSASCKFSAPPTPPLYACPSAIWVWTNGPLIPLADANPAMTTPDGHAWCYYYGRGMAGGASDGGDPWAGAFDRVVGKAVTYMPLWQESSWGEVSVSTCTGSGDGGSCTSSNTLAWGLTSAANFKGVVPVYGGPPGYYSTQYATIGGSKCAPARPAGTAANVATGYFQAWYPSDCKGHGDSDLLVYTGANGYIGGGPCLIDTVSGSPAARRGITRMQIGLAANYAGNGGGPFPDDGYYSFSWLNGGYPQFGCQPGATTGTATDPNQPAQTVPNNGYGGGS